MSVSGPVRLRYAKRAIAGVVALVVAGCSSQPLPPSAATASQRARADSSLKVVSPRSQASRSSVDSASGANVPRVQIDIGTHNAPLRAIDLSPSQQYVVTASDDKTARIWDSLTGQLRHVLRPAKGDGVAGRTYAVAIHPDNQLVAIAGSIGVDAQSKKILLFQLATGQFVREIDARGANIKRMVWSPDGAMLLATYDGEHALRVFSLDGRPLLEEKYRGASYGLSVSTDGRLAATTSLDGTVHLYEISGATITKKDSWTAPIPGPRGVAFSPDSAQLAVGYIGTVAKPGSPTVFDVANGSVVRQMKRPQLKAGDLRIVAWAADGKTVFAGGSAYLRDGEHAIFAFDLTTAKPIAHPLVARASITDLLRARDGSLLFASFDGSWGRLRDAIPVTKVGGDIADLRGPSVLRISDDASQVAFNFELGGVPAWFDLSKRLLTLGEPQVNLLSPRTRGPSSDRWENVRQPIVNNTKTRLAEVEVARSITYLPLSKDALLGTSQAIKRIGSDGRVIWSATTNAEVWSVNASRDSRIVVTAMSDGTIRWWRAADGALLMSLLMKPDGRWALWTPQGYYDASARADRMIGWSVNRSDQPVADYFSLGRFRERFNRPDVIDHLLETADIERAFDRAKVAIQAQQVASVNAVARIANTVREGPVREESVQVQPETVKAPAAPTIKTQVSIVEDRKVQFTSIADTAFPPVLRQQGPTVLQIRERVVTIPFAVKAQGDATVEVKVNGKPGQDVQIKPPARFDGEALASVRLPAPRPGAVVQVIAIDQNGVSEPLGFRIDIPAKPKPANPKPAAATALTPVPNVAAPVVFESQPANAASSVASAVAPPETVATTTPQPPSGPTIATARKSGLPRLFVLSIGVSDYKNSDYQLGLPAKDARDFLSTIQRQKGRLYSTIQSRILTNDMADRKQVELGLKWLRESVGPKDTGILFMAGHGLNGPTGDYFFLPWDADHEALKQTAVPEVSIRSTLGKMRGRTIFFVDTCHAGNVGSFRSAKRELRKLANELAATENGVIVFASSSGRQSSEEKASWGNGAFTKAVIEGLNGKADFRDTGQVTFKSLDFYVSEEVKRLTDGRQTPVTNIPLGLPDFAVARLADA